MLTDIFAYRYHDFTIWKEYTEVEQRLLNQAFGIAKEALPPYFNSDGKEIKANKLIWKSIHDQLSRELGIDELSTRYYSYTQKNALGQEWPVSGFWSWDYVCEQFVKAQFQVGLPDPERFIKERIRRVKRGRIF